MAKNFFKGGGVRKLKGLEGLEGVTKIWVGDCVKDVHKYLDIMTTTASWEVAVKTSVLFYHISKSKRFMKFIHRQRHI